MSKPELKIGDIVHPKKWIGRRQRIVRITVNDLGTTLYWLADGACFGAEELEAAK